MKQRFRYTFYGRCLVPGEFLKASARINLNGFHRPIAQINIIRDNQTGLWLVIPPETQGDVETYPDRDTAIAAAIHRDWET